MQKLMQSLYLIPTPLSDNPELQISNTHYTEIIKCIQFFFVENKRSARAFLKNFSLAVPLQELEMFELDQKVTRDQIKEQLQKLKKGSAIGVLSEAGCPCIADPGAVVVRCAHELGIVVRPLTGPSSIFLALMASGLNGQNFHFHGYLPIKEPERSNALQKMQAAAKNERTTQIIIETPYRSDATAEALIKLLPNEMALCIATDLTGVGETILTQSIASWRKAAPKIGKMPTIFLFL